MTPKIKFFDELTTTELYEILRARAQIFVVEQNCPYQDLDGLDYDSLHVFYESGGRVAACMRAYPKDGEEGVAQIGRVLTLEHGRGLGGMLLREGVKAVREKLGVSKIYIEAQCHAVGFYEREGFRVISEEFLEDGIPHVAMELGL